MGVCRARHTPAVPRVLAHPGYTGAGLARLLGAAASPRQHRRKQPLPPGVWKSNRRVGAAPDARGSVHLGYMP